MSRPKNAPSKSCLLGIGLRGNTVNLGQVHQRRLFLTPRKEAMKRMKASRPAAPCRSLSTPQGPPFPFLV